MHIVSICKKLALFRTMYPQQTIKGLLKTQICTKIRNSENYNREEDCSCVVLYSSMKELQVNLDFTILLN